jgi:hypothetical protein
MKFGRLSLALAVSLLNSAYAMSDTMLWTTGPASMVFSEGGCGCFYTPPTYSGFGYISGRIDSASPQRWAGVPFQLDDPAHITRLDAYYSDPSATKPTSVEYIIWNRTGLAAPTSIAASGTLGPYVSYANEGSSQYNPTAFLHQHDLDLSLPAGDYYLTIYGSGAPGKTAWIAWWSGGNQQNPALEQNFLWRSASYPSPGFQHYSYTGSSNLLADPKDVYNLAFALYGTEVPEPSTVWLAFLGAIFVVRRSQSLPHSRVISHVLSKWRPTQPLARRDGWANRIRIIGSWVAVIGALSVPSVARAGIIEGPLLNPENGHSYYVISSQSWTQAEKEAQSLGGHLATIRSVEENAWIAKNILVDFSPLGGPDLLNSSLWIGLYDPTRDKNGPHELSFVWAGAERVSYTNWAAPTEPNNYDGVEFFAEINYPYIAGYGALGTWNDTRINGELTGNFGIAEIVPEPCSIVLLAMGISTICNHRLQWLSRPCFLHMRRRVLIDEFPISPP